MGGTYIDGVDLRLIQWTSGFLLGGPGRLWSQSHVTGPRVLFCESRVTTMVIRTSDRMDRRVKGRSVVVSEAIINEGFCGSFSVRTYYDKYRFLQYVSDVMTCV